MSPKILVRSWVQSLGADDLAVGKLPPSCNLLLPNVYFYIYLCVFVCVHIFFPFYILPERSVSYFEIAAKSLQSCKYVYF